jgi:hypothetical protein
MPVRPSVRRLSVCLSACLPACLPVCLSVPVCLSICLSIYLYLSRSVHAIYIYALLPPLVASSFNELLVCPIRSYLKRSSIEESEMCTALAPSVRWQLRAFQQGLRVVVPDRKWGDLGGRAALH